jgi:hypothetical protein
MRIINVLFALILAVGLFLPFNQPVQADTFIVVASTDDCVSYGATIDLTNTANVFGQSGGVDFYDSGIRFQNVTEQQLHRHILHLQQGIR